MTNKEELLERLEAEATVADADAEELTVVAESAIDEKNSRIEELEETKDELESDVDELQDEKEEKENELEELQEEVDAVSELYAEELSGSFPAFDEEELQERYEVSELREKYEDAVEEGHIEEFGSSPDPRSTDGGADYTQEPNPGADGGDGEGVELSEKEEAAARAFSDRGGVWGELAEELESDE